MTSRRYIARFALLLAALALVAPAGLQAQAANERPVRGEGPEQRQPEAVKAISQLKSPYCHGLMLEVCPSSGGAALRDSIETLAEEGWKSDRIVDWVLANHGQEYLALPRRSGVSLVMAWVIPPLGVLLGLFLVVVVLRRMRRNRAPAPAAEGELSPEEEARLREAMRELDAEEEATFF